MSLLFPLFLLGLGAIAIPVYLHLARRRVRNELPWSSMMFLSGSRPPREGHRRWEDRLLLALRCLAVGLLALAFARPFVMRPAPGVSAEEPATLVLVDVSASMRRKGLWQQALAHVRARVPETGAAALYLFDRGVRAAISSGQMQALPAGQRAQTAVDRLAALGPGWGSTDLGRALTEGIEALASLRGLETTGGKGEPTRGGRIFVVSDFQEGSRLDALDAQSWPEGVSISFHSVRAASGGNFGLHPVASEAASLDDGRARVRVSRASDGEPRPAQFRVRGPEGAVVAEGELGPGQSRTLELELGTPAKGFAQALVLEGDSDPFDNRVWVTPAVPRSTTIVYIGRDRADDAKGAAFFLRNAFPVTATRQPTVIVRAPEDAALDGDLKRADLVVLTAAPLAGARSGLRAVLERGRTALWVLGSASDASAVAAVTGQRALSVTEASIDKPAALVHVNVRHPLLRPFAEARFADFAKIRFWRHRVIDDSVHETGRATVLARFDDGAPAWLAWAVGRGRLVLMTAGWQPQESQLAVSSKFVPLLHGLLEAGVESATTSPVHLVGDPLPVPSDKARTIRKPDGATIEVAVGLGGVDGADEPGVYTLDGPGGQHLLAVHVAPSESATAPMPTDRLAAVVDGRSAFVTAEHPASAGRSSTGEAVRRAALEGEQKVWRWLLGALLAIVLLESVLAGAASAGAGRRFRVEREEVRA